MRWRGRRRTWLGLLATAAVPAAVLATALALLARPAFVPPAPPDVKAVADGPAGRAADRWATAQADDQLARLRAGTPWAQWFGTSTYDLCDTEVVDGLTGRGEEWTPVDCTRTVIAYLGFDADIQQCLDQLDRTMTAMGWPEGPQSGLLANYRAAQQSQQRTPLDDQMSYRSRNHPTATADLVVQQGPALPGLPGRPPEEAGEHQRPASLPPTDGPEQRVVVLDWQTAPAATPAQARPHRYTALFAVTTRYYPPAPGPAPAPSPPVSTVY
ncbi:hypothetical protein [Kitasatospora viridis]|uniref:Uncharacterized protein n=1 Tax=Kitasatospora viridis TaxID=281105 RepID=A0A561SEC1_9ACTN|nr:hypothetical protein [Kitasatospora viridis]TWF73212.1 hypothetical protein FHX73_16363 [Kitasatospora viridis]